MTVRVSDVMTRAVATVREDTPVDTAADMLTAYGYTALPVVDEHRRLVGIVTEADLLPDPLTGRRARTVGGIMTTDVINVPEHMAASVVAHRMATYDVRAVPVVDGYDRELLVGIVTRRDVLRAPLPRWSWRSRRAHGVP
jgi:CBS domain-containing protein